MYFGRPPPNCQRPLNSTSTIPLAPLAITDGSKDTQDSRRQDWYIGQECSRRVPRTAGLQNRERYSSSHPSECSVSRPTRRFSLWTNQDKMINDENSVQLSEYYFNVCVMLETANQRRNVGNLNKYVRMALGDLERCVS